MSDPVLHVHHVTSEPHRFFGRAAELALLDRALAGLEVSVVALVGPGGQGKTAVLQHWLGLVAAGTTPVDGVFLWSFYRGADGDACLHALYAAVSGSGSGDASATWCVDRLLPLLRGRRWVVLLDGAEVVQYETGAWAGRFLHPELGRLLEELASEPQPGVTLLTSRFPLPDLERRPHARVLGLASLDADSARGLLTTLGVRGETADLDAAVAVGGSHAKAVELLGTYLVRFHDGDARAARNLPEAPETAGASDEERCVSRVLTAFQAALSREAQDVLALTTAFRQPPPEDKLLAYLASAPVRTLLHETWRRTYTPFAERAPGWLAGEVQALIDLRLLERVGRGPGANSDEGVIEAHPLVRRSFEHVLGSAGRRQGAGARAGFLRGRPDRGPRPHARRDARRRRTVPRLLRRRPLGRSRRRPGRSRPAALPLSGSGVRARPAAAVFPGRRPPPAAALARLPPPPRPRRLPRTPGRLRRRARRLSAAGRPAARRFPAGSRSTRPAA